MREITATYEAKALYSAERDKIAKEILSLVIKLTEERGIEIEQVLLLQREQQEAERKRIEATEKLAGSHNAKIVIIKD